MEEVRIRIRRSSGCQDIPLPRYMTAGAAGMDVCAAVEGELVIHPGQRAKIPTGFAIELPAGYEAQIRPRSGMAIRNGVTLVNSPGTVDADYRGEIAVILINHGEESFKVARGDRIAQMIVQQVCRVSWLETEELAPTIRGDGGFGHT
ncbi:MAG: Deoxyuridine 5'-triphosphate nucleotidohydrolase [Syntrophaceae bacterium PtaU1.Bin231]|nr:MAG: Deoxyuridine 5'-triphosphate nucleotidohydrolase [Syntrophaceae bacterium PtaU1.Bin231]HOG17815.1 dUTP diphosphatase [Syntrophales bacterium]